MPLAPGGGFNWASGLGALIGGAGEGLVAEDARKRAAAEALKNKFALSDYEFQQQKALEGMREDASMKRTQTTQDAETARAKSKDWYDTLRHGITEGRIGLDSLANTFQRSQTAAEKAIEDRAKTLLEFDHKSATERNDWQKLTPGYTTQPLFQDAQNAENELRQKQKNMSFGELLREKQNIQSMYSRAHVQHLMEGNAPLPNEFTEWAKNSGTGFTNDKGEFVPWSDPDAVKKGPKNKQLGKTKDGDYEWKNIQEKSEAISPAVINQVFDKVAALEVKDGVSETGVAKYRPLNANERMAEESRQFKMLYAAAGVEMPDSLKSLLGDDGTPLNAVKRTAGQKNNDGKPEIPQSTRLAVERLIDKDMKEWDSQAGNQKQIEGWFGKTQKELDAEFKAKRDEARQAITDEHYKSIGLTPPKQTGAQGKPDHTQFNENQKAAALSAIQAAKEAGETDTNKLREIGIQAGAQVK